jgi:hypothetical protein
MRAGGSRSMSSIERRFLSCSAGAMYVGKEGKEDDSGH